MGIVSVSQKRGYKIVKWAMLALGCLFFVFGGVTLTTGLGGTDIKPGKIVFTAAGLGVDPITGQYTLDVYKKDTEVLINTSPLGSSRQVTLTIEEGDDCMTITPKVWPGNYATLTLKADEGKPYQFGRTVKILVKCGQLQEFLFVNILLPLDQINFDYRLMYETTGLDVISGAIRASTYINEVYGDYNSSGSIDHTRSWSSFMIDLKFSVLGRAIQHATDDDTVGRVTINAVPQGVDDGVRLFGIPRNSIEFPDLSNGFRNVYIPIRVLQSVIDGGQNASMTIKFMITADYLGEQFVDYYELKITN